MGKYSAIRKYNESKGICGDPYDLIQNCIEAEKNVEIMREKVDELYYSPDPGPGYVQSMTDFQNLSLIGQEE